MFFIDCWINLKGAVYNFRIEQGMQAVARTACTTNEQLDFQKSI